MVRKPSTGEIIATSANQIMPLNSSEVQKCCTIFTRPSPPFPLGVGLGTRLHCHKNYRLALNFRRRSLISRISRIFQPFAKIFQRKFLTRGVQRARAANSRNYFNAKIAISENVDPRIFSAIRYLLGAADFSATYFLI